MLKKICGSKVLITGAEGFIGSHLTYALVELGAKVNVIVRPNKPLWRLKGISRKINIWPVNLLRKKELAIVFHKVKPLKVYHLAAMTEHGRCESLLDGVFMENISGTLNLFRAALSSDIDCLINTGTCEEYGTNEVPFSEKQRECPVSPYSLSKVCATYAAKMFYESYNLPVITLRPFLTYGPGQYPNMFIPETIIYCIKNKNVRMTYGRQTREFNFVDDIVDGYIQASSTPKAIGEVINLGNGTEYTIACVAKMIKKLTNSRSKLLLGAIPYRPGEARRFYSTSRKAKYILGWEAKTSLKDGLQKTINWYKNFHNG